MDNACNVGASGSAHLLYSEWLRGVLWNESSDVDEMQTVVGKVFVVAQNILIKRSTAT